MNDTQQTHQDNRDTSITSMVLASTTQLVCAAIAKSSMPASEVPALFTATYGVVSASVGVAPAPAEAVTPQEPAVPKGKSVFKDYIICLEDGKRFKSLKRHLMTHYGLTPDQYRTKWALKSDYPMVAPEYSASRSQLAKDMGLGRKAGTRMRGAKAASKKAA